VVAVSLRPLLTLPPPLRKEAEAHLLSLPSTEERSSQMFFLSKTGNTSMHAACASPPVLLVDMLIEQSAHSRKNVLGIQNSSGKLPLHFCE